MTPRGAFQTGKSWGKDAAYSCFCININSFQFCKDREVNEALLENNCSLKGKQKNSQCLPDTITGLVLFLWAAACAFHSVSFIAVVLVSISICCGPSRLLARYDVHFFLDVFPHELIATCFFPLSKQYELEHNSVGNSIIWLEKLTRCDASSLFFSFFDKSINYAILSLYGNFIPIGSFVSHPNGMVKIYVIYSNCVVR